MVANEDDSSEKRHDPEPTFEASAGHVPVPDPVEKQPVFEAGAGRGGVADHTIVSPTYEPAKDRDDKKTSGS